MAEEFQEKTEQATPRKKQKATEKGQILRSKDVVSMATLGGMLMVFYFGGEFFFTSLAAMTGSILSLKYGTDPVHVSKVAVLQGSKLLVPYLSVAVICSMVASFAQGGFVLKPFNIEFERINPINKLSKFISLNGVTELLKGTVKFAVGAWVVYYIIKNDLKSLPMLSAMELKPMVKVSARIISHAVGIAFLYYLVIAFVSYLLEKWQYERSLRMTRQEVKEEHKELEGDPMIKSRIRSIQREMARKRMMQEVPNATVVITNPVHLAVALKYEEGKMIAPRIVAKGSEGVAHKIKEIAAEHGVPIVEDKPLARALYKYDIDSFVPEELYVAVAKILAYIYKIKGKI